MKHALPYRNMYMIVLSAAHDPSAESMPMSIISARLEDGSEDGIVAVAAAIPLDSVRLLSRLCDSQRCSADALAC